MKALLLLLLLLPVELYSQVDPYSKSSCFVLAVRDKKPMFSGTGFFFSSGTKTYFITNNHVVGGKFYVDDFIKRNKTSPPIDSIPTSLQVRVYSFDINNAFFVGLELANYITFNDARGLMDVVAIPVNDVVKIQLKNTAILSSQNIQNDLVLAPATDLYVVGFPGTFGGESLYPLWKRGTIATEPNLDHIGVFDFWIDATARRGMSGSPVLFRGNDYTSTTAGNNIGNGAFTFLVGIYSAQDFPKEIGRVWKMSKVADDLAKLDH